METGGVGSSLLMQTLQQLSRSFLRGCRGPDSWAYYFVTESSQLEAGVSVAVLVMSQEHSETAN